MNDTVQPAVKNPVINAVRCTFCVLPFPTDLLGGMAAGNLRVKNVCPICARRVQVVMSGRVPYKHVLDRTVPRSNTNQEQAIYFRAVQWVKHLESLRKTDEMNTVMDTKAQTLDDVIGTEEASQYRGSKGIEDMEIEARRHRWNWIPKEIKP